MGKDKSGVACPFFVSGGAHMISGKLFWKKKNMMDVSFEGVIDLLRALLMPIVQSMGTGNELSVLMIR